MNARQEKDRLSPAFAGRKIKKLRICAALIAVAFLLLGAFYLRFEWNRYRNIASSEAVMLAQSMEALLHPEHIAQLSGGAEDLDTPAYVLTKSSLMRLAEAMDSIRFAYLMGVQNGNLVFLVDSEPPESPDYSLPGQVFTEAEDIDWEPLRSGRTVLTPPVADRWGTWISALVPVKDPVSGRVIAVFGIDFDAAEWHSKLWGRMVPDLVVVLCLVLLSFALLRALFQHFWLKNLSRQLALDEALYRSVFEQVPIGIAVVDDKSFIIKSEFGQMNINPEFERILGRSRRDLAHVKWTEITHPEDLPADLEKFALFKAGKIKSYSMEKRFLRPDGSHIWTYMIVSPLLGSPLRHSLHLCLLTDISARKEAEESLRESERIKSVLLSNLPGMAYRCDYDRDWTMQIISEGCYDLTGYPPECLIQNRVLSYNDIITPEYREILWQEWERVLAAGKPFKYEYEITTADGERKWVLELGEGVYDEDGRVTALEGIVLDISERKKMENELRFNSEHDSLTGLMNRRSLVNALTREAAAHISENRAVVGINLSTIHSLSMRYGFHYSQALVKRIADALVPYCSDNRRLFSTYEYQFAFYLKAYKDAAELTSFCESAAGTIESILSIERVGGGIGVVEIGKGQAFDAEQLLKNLLIASEKAVSTLETDIGICFFDKEMEEKIIREELISREMTQIAAGKRVDRLFLQYQPILDLPTNRICGFEALARMWSRHPRLVPPLEFIPIAEKTKLIVPLGDLILQNALRFLKTLEENGHDATAVSINVSAIQLLRKGFVERVDRMIRETGVNPSNVMLEITESVFASNYEEINKALGELRGLGIGIAIDDFGTGYSSFARQRELHADCIKIDKYFLDKLMELEPGKAIIGDIISFGHKLGHCIVAEGVEHEKQLQYLRRHGCDKAQGYLIGRPLDEGAALALLGGER